MRVLLTGVRQLSHSSVAQHDTMGAGGAGSVGGPETVAAIKKITGAQPTHRQPLLQGRAAPSCQTLQGTVMHAGQVAE